MMSASGSWHTPSEPQRFDGPPTRSAIVLVVTVAVTDAALATARDTLAGLADLTKTVAFRDLSADVSCTAAIGSRVWTSLTGRTAPAELHPFREITGATHTAIATPGDLLFHIRAERADLCFEFERLLLDQLGDAVRVEDETPCFRYFDMRDLLGFVDGTANPVGQELAASTIIGDEDPEFAGGCYLVTQKYLHPLDAWTALSTEEQERVIGRTKIDNVELDDAGPAEQKAHKTLSTITGEDGTEYAILRENMPFGSPAAGEFGTYFIGYARYLWVIEKMLERMFVGDPPGLHDRILDFSTPHTGSVFFAPSAELLASLG